MSDRARAFAVWLAGAAVLLVVAGVAIAIRTGEPHWINRSGALIAALAAVAILFQIRAEITIEHEREKVSHLEATDADPGDLMPTERLELLLLARQREQALGAFHHERLQIGGIVAVTAALGELLHGFGDVWFHP